MAESVRPLSSTISKAKDVFVSYGREDGVREFAKKLKTDLERNGVSVWLDVDDIPTGSDFHVEIGVALKSCRALVPILTKKYVHSRYCKGELYVANSREKILLPVIYEDGWDEGEEGAGVNYIVGGYNWAFFRPNKDDYQESLNKLIHGAKLKLGGTLPPTCTPMGVAVRDIEKWQELGQQLNVDPEKLSNLFKSGRSGADCRDEMMAYWEKHNEGASWERLAQALSRMGENQLAEKILMEHGSSVNKPSSQTHPTPPGNNDLTCNSTCVTIGELVIFSKEVIGQGAFGTVFKGCWRSKPCAAKMLGNEVYTGVSIAHQGLVQVEALAKFKRECDFMKTLVHPNIVAYYDTLFHPGSNLPILVMELMETSLRHYLTNAENLSRKIQVHLCRCVAAALEFLHDHNLVHRDLCGDNILLRCSDNVIPVAKVTDFGMSRLIVKQPDMSHMTHSLSAMQHRPGYLPPEAPEYPTDYDSSLDIFMFGAVMTQIASKAPTIKSKEFRQKLINQLDAIRHPLRPVIKLCLNEKKESRPVASKLFACLEYACESLANEGAGCQEVDKITNRMQELCIGQSTASAGTNLATDVSSQIRTFMRTFESLALSCLCELEETKVGLRKFRTSLMLLPATIKLEHTAFLKENLPTFLKAEGLEEIFMHLNLYWNFIDYSLLDYIIDRFCSEELKEEMTRYRSDLAQFRKETTVRQLIRSWPMHRVEPPPSFTEFTSTLDRDAATFTLEELEELRMKICGEFSLSNFILMFRGVVEGSLVITWFIPSGIVAQFRQDLLAKAVSRSSFFEDNAITNVSLDHKLVSVFLPRPLSIASQASNGGSLDNSSYKKEYSEEVFTAESVTQLQEQIQSLMEGQSEPLWKNQSITEEYQWEIYVRTLTGKIITVRCNETDLVADVKSTIERKEGIPLSNQQLVKRETQEDKEKGTEIINIELNDSVPLSEYHIQNYQELILTRVKPPAHQTVLPTLPGIQPIVIATPELASIRVQSSSGENYTVKIDINAPVSELKSILRKQLGSELGEQRLIFAGRELYNDQVLYECNVRDGSTVHLVMLHFRDRVVYVKMLNGKSFPLECKANNTIGTIKAMIHDEEYIPADQQRLVFAGQGLDDDRKTLTDYNIKHGDVIHLAFKRGGSLPLSRIGTGKIFVKAPYHAPMRVDVQSTDTIANVKIKVQRALVDHAADNELAEFPEFMAHEQELMIAGRRLTNDQVLGELEIKDGDTLHLLFTQRQHSLEEIVIKTFSGDSFTVKATPTDTVETVKSRIHERQGISPDSQKIIYAGRELENHTRLGELNVHTATTFYLEVIQPPKIYVRPLIGDAISLDFEPNITIADVKRQIQEREGISSNLVSLLFGGHELEDQQTLSSCGIQDKSTIYMYRTATVEPILFVKVPTLQKTVVLEYDPEATIKSVKMKLSEKEQISFDDQTLMFEGVHLEDNGTLGSYDIPQEGAIDLITVTDRSRKDSQSVTAEERDYTTDLHIIEDYNYNNVMPDVM